MADNVNAFSPRDLQAGDLVVAVNPVTGSSLNMLVLPCAIAGTSDRQKPGQRDKTDLFLVVPGKWAAPVSRISDKLTIGDLRIERIYGPATDWCRASMNDIASRCLLWERKLEIPKEIEEFRKALDALTAAARKAGITIDIADKPEWFGF